MSQLPCPYCHNPVPIHREGIQTCPHCQAIIGVMDGEVVGVMRK